MDKRAQDELDERNDEKLFIPAVESFFGLRLVPVSTAFAFRHSGEIIFFNPQSAVTRVLRNDCGSYKSHVPFIRFAHNAT
jgi:hypothetical protein